MTQPTHPIVDLSYDGLQAMLTRALWISIALGALASLAVTLGSNWRNGAMLLTGAAVSAASILEWRHLVRVVNERMDRERKPASAAVVVTLFVLRLAVFAAVIYGSLKCFQGSVVALLGGLGLAVMSVGWEVIRLLRQ
jgi:ATP synthase I subunit